MENIFTKMKVFIVDDLETMRTEISMYLNQLGCNQIEFAKDGQEAWDNLVEKTRLGQTYDLIISDIKMPEMDGLSLLENAKQLNGTSNIPFLVVSTESELPTIMGAIKLGQIIILLNLFPNLNSRIRLKEFSESKLN